jgi:hypothetical protein
MVDAYESDTSRSIWLAGALLAWAAAMWALFFKAWEVIA